MLYILYPYIRKNYILLYISINNTYTVNTVHST